MEAFYTVPHGGWHMTYFMTPEVGPLIVALSQPFDLIAQPLILGL
jgi:hypothetical protein